jgi:hypothetical protein
MGRKNRDRVSKYKSETKEVEVEVDDTEEEDESIRLQKFHEHQFNIMWETRRAMIQYCDDMCIPLCDYLTIDMFEDFMDYLASSQ